MGETAAKFATEMEGKGEKTSIQTAEICEAGNARDCGEDEATGASHCSRRSAEEANSADAGALRYTQWRAQRRIRLGGDEGNRMRGEFPITRLHA